MISEYSNIAVRNITKKGIRSWLTMLGIFVGIAAVVSLISLGAGLDEAVKEQFAMLGNDVIMVMPGSQYGQSFGSDKLDEDDEEIVASVRGMDKVAPMLTKISQVRYGREIVYTWVTGSPVDDRYEVIEKMSGFHVVAGREPVASDKYKAAVGYLWGEGDIIEGHKVKIGDKLEVEGQEFKVIGIFSQIGNEQDDSNVYIPLDVAQDIFNDDGYDIIMGRVKEGFDPAEVAEDIRDKMRKDRDLDVGEEDFNVQTMEQLMDSVNGILGAVNAVLLGIAGISLFVGGIGIMNTMYTSVLERTQEIGVMKAVGAKNRDILLMFLVEAGVLGAFGGVVGVIIGLSLSKSIEYLASTTNETFLKASTSPYIIVGALAFSFVVGCISGVLPAMQAAKLKPVDALRYE